MNVRCSSCGNKVVQKNEQGTRIRTQGPIVFSQDGQCVGQCFWCKSPVTLPIELTKSYHAPSERLVIVERAKAPTSNNDS